MTEDLSSKLEFTGERFTPECVREIWYEHVHRYVLAAEVVQGRDVLDAACGEGYGSSLLAHKARNVTGIDISQAAISHASGRYRASNLSFQHADCRKLPFADGQFDCVVSFETLEHMQDQVEMLREFRRVLRADGVLLISSPDKAIYTDLLKNDNPFHVRELYRHELEDLLAQEFPAVQILGHKLAFHSMIWPLNAGNAAHMDSQVTQSVVTLHQERDGLSRSSHQPQSEAVYFIALCAAGYEFLPQWVDRLWLFDDAEESVYEHYRHEIRKNMQAGKILQNKDREIEDLKLALQKSKQNSPVSWWRRWFGNQ